MTKKVKRLAAFLIILLAGSWWGQSADGQDFLNGSFEDYGQDSCGVNLLNDRFNALMDNCTAFGPKDEIDVLTNTCGSVEASDGAYFIAINSVMGIVDELSMELATSLIQGTRYAFSFHERRGGGANTSNGIRIGLSGDPSQFGQQIYASTTLDDSWKEHYVEFTAPLNGKHLTLRGNANFESWVLLDHFQKACFRDVDLGPDTTVCFANEMVLSLDHSYESYLWQDGSTSASFNVEVPGLHWVEVMANGCALRDSIFIEEFPQNCACSFFVPNAFSPNGDGVNDRLLVSSTCAVLSFEMKIFDRTGAVIFSSKDPEIPWDGSEPGATMNPAVLTYIIRFQFAHDNAPRMQTGDITVLR